jgi:opine dehydrogenase
LEQKGETTVASIERVAILGAGPGAIAAAAGLSRRGHRVALYNRTPGRVAPLQERSGVEIEGSLGDTFIPISTITTDMAEALKDAQLVATAVPANGQRGLIEACLPYLKPGQIILLMTGCAGSLEMAGILRLAGFDLDQTLLGECVVVPYSARMVAPDRVRIKLSSDEKPKRMRAAAFPGRNTPEMIERLDGMFHLLPKPNVLDPGLNNPNFLIHPAPMLMNYAAVERADGKFSIMNEGMTPGTLRALDAVDAEKMALQRALGLEVLSIDDFYRETGVGPQVYRAPGEPFGLNDRAWDRYVTEDVPYGTVMYASFGRLLGVPTPVCDSVNTLLSILKQTDFCAQGRTVERLGLAGLTAPQIQTYLATGERPA